MAKISKINCIRSMTLTPKNFFWIDILPRCQTVVDDDSGNFFCIHHLSYFFQLTRTDKGLRVVLFRFLSPVTITTTAPAVLARLANSSMERVRSCPCPGVPHQSAGLVPLFLRINHLKTPLSGFKYGLATPGSYLIKVTCNDYGTRSTDVGKTTSSLFETLTYLPQRSAPPRK